MTRTKGESKKEDEREHCESSFIKTLALARRGRKGQRKTKLLNCEPLQFLEKKIPKGEECELREKAHSLNEARKNIHKKLLMMRGSYASRQYNRYNKINLR